MGCSATTVKTLPFEKRSENNREIRCTIGLNLREQSVENWSLVERNILSGTSMGNQSARIGDDCTKGCTASASKSSEGIVNLGDQLMRGRARPACA